MGTLLDLKSRSPQSSNQGKAHGWDRLHGFVQLPWPWTPSGTYDIGNLLGQHPISHGHATSSEGIFCLAKVLCGTGRGGWHCSLGTRVYGDVCLSGFLQCCVVWVKERPLPQARPAARTRALTSSLFCVETTTFILGTSTHKTYKPFEAAKIDPSFFLRGWRKQAPVVPITLFARKNIFV